MLVCHATCSTNSNNNDNTCNCIEGWGAVCLWLRQAEGSKENAVECYCCLGACGKLQAKGLLQQQSLVTVVMRLCHSNVRLPLGILRLFSNRNAGKLFRFYSFCQFLDNSIRSYCSYCCYLVRCTSPSRKILHNLAKTAQFTPPLFVDACSRLVEDCRCFTVSIKIMMIIVGFKLDVKTMSSNNSIYNQTLHLSSSLIIYFSQFKLQIILSKNSLSE